MTQPALKEIVCENCAEFEVLKEVPVLKEVNKIKKRERKEAKAKNLTKIGSRIRRPGEVRIMDIEKVKPVMYERNFGIY